MSERDLSAAVAAPSFGEAMEELEEILQRIEGEEVDVDRLAAELRRASQLLDLARDKIRRAEVEVTQIVQGMEAAATPPSAAGSAPSAISAPPAREPEEPEDDESELDQDDIPF
ncbi:MAG TPA: exodeoxyribonuclease VII small subunit [Thermoanaerobaculia bacterium]|nr:exodeoxyribonuclease VII small subunit [Thermoanaerobaculia bacterium]